MPTGLIPASAMPGSLKVTVRTAVPSPARKERSVVLVDQFKTGGFVVVAVASLVVEAVVEVEVEVVVACVVAEVLVTAVVGIAEVVGCVVACVAEVGVCFLQAARQNKARMMQMHIAKRYDFRFIVLPPIILAADGIYTI